MIIVSNRVQIPDERVDTFIDRLQSNHGIEEQPGFRGLKVLSPVDAEGHVTMTYWDSIEDYENWKDGSSFDQAHRDSSAKQVFDAPNTVEIHEVAVERTPNTDGDRTDARSHTD